MRLTIIRGSNGTLMVVPRVLLPSGQAIPSAVQVSGFVFGREVGPLFAR